MKIFRYDAENVLTEETPAENLTTVNVNHIWYWRDYGWGMPYPTKTSHNLHFAHGIDFKHVSVRNSELH